MTHPSRAQTALISILLTMGLAPISPISPISPLAFTGPIPAAEAAPARSAQPSKVGNLREGERAPWLAGWSLGGGVSNLAEVMRRGRRGYVVLLSSTRCALCEEGLRLISREWAQLERQGVQVVVLFSEDITPQALGAWLAERGLLGGEEGAAERRGPVVLIDRHRAFLSRAGLIDVSGRPTLPYSLVLDRAGVITGLIGQEGEDLAEVILLALSGA